MALAPYKSGTTKSVPLLCEGRTVRFPFFKGRCWASVYPILVALAGRRLVYGTRQNVTQPTSIKIPIPRTNPAQRGGAGCAEDDTHRRILERSSDECHPPNRSPQRGNVVLDFPARRRRVAPAIWRRRKPAGSVPGGN